MPLAPRPSRPTTPTSTSRGPLDPYAPPAFEARRGHRAWTAATRVHVLGAAVYVLYGVAFVVGGLEADNPSLGAAADGLSGLAVVAKIGFSIAGVLWLGDAFGRLPRRGRDDRFTGKELFLRFLIPFYNLYWMFATTGELCQALDRALERLGRRPAAPRDVAAVACIAQLVCTALGRAAGRATGASLFAFAVVVPPALWMMFTARVEATLRELSDVSTRANDEEL